MLIVVVVVDDDVGFVEHFSLSLILFINANIGFDLVTLLDVKFEAVVVVVVVDCFIFVISFEFIKSPIFVNCPISIDLHLEE